MNVFRKKSEGILDSAMESMYSPASADRRRIRRLAEQWWKKKLGVVGVVGLTLLLFVAVLSAWISPYEYSAAAPAERLMGPSGAHYFGTDAIGRDLFTRTMYGARLGLAVGTLTMLVTMVIMLTIGIVTGYFGGIVDASFQRIVDAVQSFPTLLVLLTVIMMAGQGLWQVVVGMSLLFAVGQSRVIRSATILLRDLPFIEAARASGAGPMRIILRHLAPNVFPLALVLGTSVFGSAILTEAVLGFLGYGISPTLPTWGRMLQEGRISMLQSPWVVLWPGFFLAIAVFSVNVVGDALRDLIDPRLRSS